MTHTPLPFQFLRFHAAQPGKHLLVLGAVHGNERCGPPAIHHIARLLESGALPLHCGTVTLVPVANPRAYAENKRFIDRNLNRELYLKPQPDAYEDTLDGMLCPLLEQADVLLDIHSYASPGGPFAFLGTGSDAELAYGQHLGIRDFVYGWAEAFQNSDEDPRAGWGTTDVIRQHGGIAVTVECGQHLNADNEAIAKRTILLAMHHLGHIQSPDSLLADLPPEPQQPARFVKMQRVFRKQAEGQFTRNWQHYDTVAAGQPIATYTNGSTITAPDDGYIILPKTNPPIGGEWFYFGIGTPAPQPTHSCITNAS